MGKTLKKNLKKKNKRTLKKGGFNVQQLTAAIAICGFFKFDEILLEHRNTKDRITFKYIPLSNEIKIKKAQGDKITKKLLGDGIYKTQNRNILINYNGDRVTTNQGEDIIMEQYKIFVSDGTTSYEVPGKNSIDNSISEFETTGQKPRNIQDGGYPLLIDSGIYDTMALDILDPSKLSIFFSEVLNSTESIIETSLFTQQKNEQIIAVCLDKLRISSVKDYNEKIENLLNSQNINFNSDNLLFLSYFWGISTLYFNNLKYISEKRMEAAQLEAVLRLNTSTPPIGGLLTSSSATETETESMENG
jgi:hypothetical protein